MMMHRRHLLTVILGWLPHRCSSELPAVKVRGEAMTAARAVEEMPAGRAAVTLAEETPAMREAREPETARAEATAKAPAVAPPEGQTTTITIRTNKPVTDATLPHKASDDH